MKQEEIKELIKIFDESDITKLKIEDKDFSISLSKEATVATVATPAVTAPAPTATPAAPAQSEAPKQESSKPAGVTINSPMVGTFYKAPSPGAPAFVKVGDTVNKGQAVGIIEAMKIMNEIEAEFDCKILEVLVEDGQPVEFDTPLFVVEKK